MSDPPHLAALQKAEALADAGSFAQALPTCDRVLAEDPEDAAALTLKGRCLEGLGRPADALPCYKLARLYLPSYAPVRYNLARALDASGDPDGALAEYDECLRLDGSHFAARASRGALRAARGDEAGALADYDELVRRAPETGHPFLLRGGFHLTFKHHNAAYEDFKTAMRLSPQLKGDLDRLLRENAEPLPPSAEEPHGPF
ncbi:MAG: tetratricopeptide repeat protein [Elusimicrobia bacterium]|nr:tetratricopeptide repeat protein [Elusimicrobiota bacterium]